MKITNFNDVFRYIFDTMEVVDELPEFWVSDDVYHEVSESVYWEEMAAKSFTDETGLNPDDNEEEFVKYETEYYLDVAGDFYVAYKVTGDNLDKLPDEVPVYWCDELQSYVFLQGWYGMAAYLMKLDDAFDWEV